MGPVYPKPPHVPQTATQSPGPYVGVFVVGAAVGTNVGVTGAEVTPGGNAVGAFVAVGALVEAAPGWHCL